MKQKICQHLPLRLIGCIVQGSFQQWAGIQLESSLGCGLIACKVRLQSKLVIKLARFAARQLFKTIVFQSGQGSISHYWIRQVRFLILAPSVGIPAFAGPDHGDFWLARRIGRTVTRSFSSCVDRQ